VIKIPVTKIAAAALLIGSMTIAPLLDNSDMLTSPESDPIPAQTPQFRIQRQQDKLVLSGHTSSLQHEQALLRIAKLSYPDIRISTEFRALGIVPDYWSDSTEKVLEFLVESHSAVALLSVDELIIRAVIINETAWKTRLEALKKNMPASIPITSETILVDPTISVSEVCERAFQSFEPGRINFEESGVEFRSSAYPRLDRLIALANACPDSEIIITGHTDASGNEPWNQTLSVHRASAVGDYLANGGISRERLQILGVGSDEPVANDSTRYGRSLNRRIEIELSLSD
jgi:OOP family OmpA-OmpF porin